MIRYEIYSNVANSEQGLQHFPHLEDLAQHLRFHALETRYVKHVAREEGEINLAGGQYGRGVRVPGTAVRYVRPETNLRGCLTWLRSVAARPDRVRRRPYLDVGVAAADARGVVPVCEHVQSRAHQRLGEVLARRVDAVAGPAGDPPDEFFGHSVSPEGCRILGSFGCDRIKRLLLYDTH